jgi:DNA-binding transcriptional LysR family regulator
VNLNLERLALLSALRQRGTLAAVARQFDVTPSAVSQQLSVLEREIGGELLERQGRSVALTPLGDAVVGALDPVLVELERAANAIESFMGAIGGPYVVAAVPSVALSVVSSAAVALGHTAPNLDVKVVDAEATTSIDRLLRRDVDLAVIDTYDDIPFVLPDGVEATVLGREPLMVLAPAALVAADHGGSIRLRRLADLPWVLPPADVACGDAARLACRREGFEPLVRWESDDLMLLREYVAAGLGASVLPRLAVRHPPAGTVVLSIDGYPIMRTVQAVTRTATSERPQQRLFLDALATASTQHLDATGAAVRSR